jgi:hypothetical protein
MDSSGTAYVAYTQDRNIGDGGHVFVAKSVSGAGGLPTFPDAAVDTLSLLPDSYFPSKPHLAITKSGQLLVAFYDVALGESDHLYVLRSTTDASLAFEATIFDQAITPPSDGGYVEPKLITEASTDTVLMLFAQVNWWEFSTGLSIFRSPDSGANWDPPVDLDYFSSVNVATAFSPNLDGIYLPATNKWIVAWTNNSWDAALGILTDVSATSSDDDGITWLSDPAAPQLAQDQAICDEAGTTCYSSVGYPQQLQGVALSGTDSAFFLLTDGRASHGTSSDLWGSVWDGTPNDLDPYTAGTAKRIDTDTGTGVDPASFDVLTNMPTIVSDANGTVYSAFSSISRGRLSDVHVAVSNDGGFTFGTPVLVGDADATGDGSPNAFDLVPANNSTSPVVAATNDGNVYFGYQSDVDDQSSFPPTSHRQIRFNHSTDFGATWQTADVVLKDFGYGEFLTGFYLYDIPNVQVNAGSAESVYVTWSNGASIVARRSTDGGSTFDPEAQVDAGSTYAASPRVCVFPGGGDSGADKVVAVYFAQLLDETQTIVSSISLDGGLTWNPGVSVRDPLADGSAFAPVNIACDPNGKVFAVWSDMRNGYGIYIRGASFDNGSDTWTDAEVVTLNEFAISPPRAAYTAGGVAVAFVDFPATQPAIYVARSTDALGTAFGAPVQLDGDIAGDYPITPQLTADTRGNAWVSWLEISPGASEYVSGQPVSVLARHSSDGFATPDPVIYRLDRKDPAGTYPLEYDEYPNCASDSGVAFFTYNAWRTGRHMEPVVAAFAPGNLGRTATVKLTDGDIDSSGRVDGFDLIRLGRAFGTGCHEAGYDRRSDVNKDCAVGGNDLSALAPNFGKSN